MDDNGEPYLSNESVIEIQKSKPKGIGKTGKVRMMYNLNSHRYSEDGTESKPKAKPVEKEKYSRNNEHEEYKPYKDYDSECGF